MSAGVVIALGVAAALAAADHEPPLTPTGGEGAASPGEEIVVTATRSPRPARDVPAAVTVLPRAELMRSPAKTTDELLRVVPSFGLFRRSSSVVADPTSQGVNLRGIGPSGVSRSLVLVDGLPANDAFGGWVYWRALPRLGVETVEVVPGGGSALYGSSALGGVTQLRSRAPEGSLELAAEGGTADTLQGGVRAARRWGPLAAVVEGETLRSTGYRVVEAAQRGPVDGTAGSEHVTMNGRVEARASPALAFTLRAGWFDEDQDGGTEFTNAEVSRLAWSAAARLTPEAGGALDLAVFGHRNEFEQERARILPGRTGEVLASTQDVPSRDVGVALGWTDRPRPLLGTHTLSAGGDVRRITADAREEVEATATAPARLRDAGGEQRLFGVFVQDVWDVTEAVAVVAAVRWDRWDELDGRRLEQAEGAPPERDDRFPRRSSAEVNPKLGVRVRPLEWLTVRAAAYRAFRAPTLNELYRAFQVGPVVTEPNPQLGPETLRGGEAGVEVRVPGWPSARVTGFWNQLDGPITNVTIGDPADDLRQRQNLGRARIRGVETEAAWRFARAWQATAAFTWLEPEVTSAPGQPQLVGKDLPQDPRQRASLTLAFDDPRWLAAAVQVRRVGRQYEDDQNTLPMAGFTVLDVSASRRVAPGVDVVLAVENLLDETYLVGRAGGLNTVGQPRFFHGGLRARFGG